MTRARPWWRRHRVRTVLLVVLPVVVAGVAVVARRAPAVVRSTEPRAQHRQDLAERPGDVVLVALGDSLTRGIGSSSPETTSVAALADDLGDRTGATVRAVDLSVTGATADPRPSVPGPDGSAP